MVERIQDQGSNDRPQAQNEPMQAQVMAAYDDWEARIISAGVAGAESGPSNSS